jgi:hypothetical protein
MSELAHVVRTQHFDTGQVEMMCGERREKWEDPERDTAMCGGCAVELVNLLKHRLDSQQDTAERTRRIVMREVLAQTAELEALTEEVKGLRKQVRKARKQAEEDKG